MRPAAAALGDSVGVCRAQSLASLPGTATGACHPGQGQDTHGRWGLSSARRARQERPGVDAHQGLPSWRELVKGVISINFN